MNELVKRLKTEWTDKETRQVYCDEFLNASIATQLKVLREERGLTQSDLAAMADMKQPRIAALEDVNYSSWTINVLRRLAEAFDLTLIVRFDSFGERLRDIESFSIQSLQRPSFEQDPVFHMTSTPANHSGGSISEDFAGSGEFNQERKTVDNIDGWRARKREAEPFASRRTATERGVKYGDYLGGTGSRDLVR